MRDDDGNIVDVDDFYDINITVRKHKYLNKFSFWNGDGAVPGTKKFGNGHLFRRPTTQRSRRNSVCFKDDNEPPVRAKQNTANLPTNYDDIHRSNLYNKSWKSFRKTQWKA